MKALVLTQPWATLVALGLKRIETRSWSTKHDGDLIICAGKSFPAEARAVLVEEPFARVLRANELGGWPFDRLASLCGKALCRVRIHRCVRFEEDTVDHLETRYDASEDERYFGNYTQGRYGFLMHMLRPLAVPVPVHGNRRIFNLTEAESEAIQAELARSAGTP